MLISPYLNRRLNSIKLLNELINKIKNKMIYPNGYWIEYPISMQYPQSNDNPLSKLNPKSIIQNINNSENNNNNNNNNKKLTIKFINITYYLNIELICNNIINY